MPTKNIECQLAQGQIGRYLNGDRFSDVAVKQLEAHIADCEECTALLAERKKAVMAMLGEVAATKAVVQMEVPSPSGNAAEKLMAVLAKASPTTAPKAAAEQTATPKLTISTIFPKPVLYCGALAIVLMGMSYVSKGALKAFGPTAGQALASDAATTAAPARSAETPQKSVKPTTTSERAVSTSNPAARSNPPSSAPTSSPAPTPPAAASKPTPIPKAPTTAKPGATKISAAKPLATKAPKARSTPSPIVAPAPRHTAPATRIVVHRVHRRPRFAYRHGPYGRANASRQGVRVYDPQGNPLH